MPTHTKDYTTMPDGAPADHTHYGSGANTVSSSRLLTTGLGNTIVGGATIDVTNSAGAKRAKGRFSLVNVGSGAGFGIPGGGVVLNYTHGTGALGFLGFRIVGRYNKTATSGNANMRIFVLGSRASVGDPSLVDDSFLLGAWLTIGEVVVIEARYVPNAVEYRAYREVAGAPAYRSVAVNSAYSSIEGPSGIIDVGGEDLGSNTQWLSVESEGDWSTPVGASLDMSLSISADILSRFEVGGGASSQFDASASLYGWIAEPEGVGNWVEPNAPNIGWT